MLNNIFGQQKRNVRSVDKTVMAFCIITILNQCNVISLECKNTEVAECNHLLLAYLKVCTSSMNLLLYALYYIYIYMDMF